MQVQRLYLGSQEQQATFRFSETNLFGLQQQKGARLVSGCITEEQNEVSKIQKTNKAN